MYDEMAATSDLTMTYNLKHTYTYLQLGTNTTKNFHNHKKFHAWLVVHRQPLDQESPTYYD